MYNCISHLLATMTHSTLRNYGLPGLTSQLIGGSCRVDGADRGLVRLFTAERDTPEFLTPHSHRYDFECLVLSGEVLHRTYTLTDERGEHISRWWRSSLVNTDGAPGKYTQEPHFDSELYRAEAKRFSQGQTYGLDSQVIHSIAFSRGTSVLFFEGPTKHSASCILEPVSNGVRIPTFRVEPWMFQRAGADHAPTA